MDNLNNMPTGRGFQPFPFGRCQVCESEATGNHYGANTCEGCKGFFKRSLPVYRTFRCFFGNKCEVIPDTRNRCKACRFRKCVDAGMSLDAVKMGRIPKAVKEHAIEKTVIKISSRERVSPQSSASSDMLGGTPGSQVSPGASSRGVSSSPTNQEMVLARTELPFLAEPSDTVVQGCVASISSLVPMSSPSSLSTNYRFHPYDRGYQTDQFVAASNRLPTHWTGYQLPASGLPKTKTLSSGVKHGQGPSVIRGPDKARRTSRYSRDKRISRLAAGLRADNPFSSFKDGLQGNNTRQGIYEEPRTPIEAEKAKYQSVSVMHPRISPLAHMALTGALNENEPDLPVPPADLVTAVMATSDTAVAVLEPNLRGGTHCMPVVPVDVLVFQPSYVPPEKRPVATSSGVFSSHHSKYRKMAVDYRNTISQLQIPASPTLCYLRKVASCPELKSAMCQNTIRVISQKNNEIYGEETRANNVFLKEIMSSGIMPDQSDRSPQAMRDILKERLITQVKRIILLGDGIPGFRNLDTNDQHSLFRTCILDVWMVHSARFLREKQSYILFVESNTHYARYWMEMFLTDEFLETVFELARRINALDLSFDELSLLKTILIVRPDRTKLHDVRFITSLHNHLLESLKLAVRMRRPLESAQLLEDLHGLLKDWRILDVMQEKYVHPIDLSNFSKGPWKVEDTETRSAISVSPASSRCTSRSGTSEQRGTLSPNATSCN